MICEVGLLTRKASRNLTVDDEMHPYNELILVGNLTLRLEKWSERLSWLILRAGISVRRLKIPAR